MSGNLGLGERLELPSPLEPPSVAARIFDKNRWDEVTEDEAHVLAMTVDGRTARMRVRVLKQYGSGACDLEAVTLRPGDIVGQVVRIQLFVENKLVADHAFNQFVGPQHRLAVQFRLVGVA